MFFCRTQITSLTHVHRKDIDSVKSLLLNQNAAPPSESNQPTADAPQTSKDTTTSTINLTPIGTIRTVFTAKRAVPRQANLANSISSRIEISKDLYTNPDQSLATLDEFSHIWIIYHFHKNEPHSKAKVAPPRLDGKKVGVFASRCPHRPNPIGMSLVKLERVEGSTIYFIGGDMVDETPVIDIKPYIPAYDGPQKNQSNPGTPTRSMREDPEGEEDDEEIAQTFNKAASVSSQPDPATDADTSASVKVPSWIDGKKPLEVSFSDGAMQQIEELNINRKTIAEILQQDPRSVYVREKFSSQIYNFQVDGNNVICKFDDVKGSVNVLQVRKSMTMT